MLPADQLLYLSLTYLSLSLSDHFLLPGRGADRQTDRQETHLPSAINYSSAHTHHLRVSFYVDNVFILYNATKKALDRLLKLVM